MRAASLPSANRMVLFVFSIYNFYREMLPVAEHFARLGFHVHAVIGWSGATAEQSKEYCEAIGITVHDLPADLKYGEAQARNQQPAQVNQFIEGRNDDVFIRAWNALLSPARTLHSLIGLTARQLRMRELAEELVAEIAPVLVFAGAFHSCGEFDNGIARVCHRKRILYCCLPVSVYAGGERQVITARFNNIQLGMVPRSLEPSDSLLNELLAVLFPGWTREQAGNRIFMFQPEKMLTAWLTGLLEKNPWQKPSEQFDIVFVESESSRQMLAESNYDTSKVVISGKPLLDTVFDNLNNQEYTAELYDYLGLSVDEPFILFNVEPSAEHHYSSWEDHWQRFKDLMDCMKSTGAKVVLSLHPLCDPAKYRHVEQEYGFRVSEEYKIGQLYPYCNLSVSFPCSTNAFSLIFGRRLIIYDFFGLTKDEYPTHDLYRIQGALYAYDVEQLSRYIREFMDRPEHKAPPSNLIKTHPSACATIYQTAVKRFGLGD